MKYKRFLTIGFDLLFIPLLFAVKKTTAFMLADFSDCFFYKHGIICPACGGTRAVYNFVSGNFAASFGFNPFIFLVIIYMIAVIIIFNLEFLFGLRFAKTARKYIFNCKVLIGFAVCYAIFGILRNFV